MKAIVVGAGGIARDLLRRLGEIWEVTLVDISTDRIDLASASVSASSTALSRRR